MKETMLKEHNPNNGTSNRQPTVRELQDTITELQDELEQKHKALLAWKDLANRNHRWVNKLEDQIFTIEKGLKDHGFVRLPGDVTQRIQYLLTYIQELEDGKALLYALVSQSFLDGVNYAGSKDASSVGVQKV